MIELLLLAACSFGQLPAKELPIVPATLLETKLIDFIKKQQQLFVRKSFNEYDCFTDVQLEKLKTDIDADVGPSRDYSDEELDKIDKLLAEDTGSPPGARLATPSIPSKLRPGSKVTKAIVTDPDFKIIIKSLQQQIIQMSKTDGPRPWEVQKFESDMYKNALKIFRPTWEQLGRIDPEGQTEAGQQGDILIGKIVVQLLKEKMGAWRNLQGIKRLEQPLD